MEKETDIMNVKVERDFKRPSSGAPCRLENPLLIPPRHRLGPRHLAAREAGAGMTLPCCWTSPLSVFFFLSPLLSLSLSLSSLLSRYTSLSLCHLSTFPAEGGMHIVVSLARVRAEYSGFEPVLLFTGSPDPRSRAAGKHHPAGPPGKREREESERTERQRWDRER